MEKAARSRHGEVPASSGLEHVSIPLVIRIVLAVDDEFSGVRNCGAVLDGLLPHWSTCYRYTRLRRFGLAEASVLASKEPIKRIRRTNKGRRTTSLLRRLQFK